MENSFVSWIATKGHVVVIALFVYFPSIVAEAISEPRLVESTLTPPWHERPEILNGGLQSCEVGTEKGIDVLWPLCGGRIDGTKLGQDGGAKGCASGSAASLKVVTPKEMSANSSRQQNGSEGGEVFNDIARQIIQGVLLAVLIAWPIMWLGDAGPYGGMKPNVELRGAALLRRPT